MVKAKLVGVVSKPQDSQMFAAPEGQSGGSSAHHLVSSPAGRKRVNGGMVGIGVKVLGSGLLLSV